VYNANIIKDIEEGKDLRIIIFVLVITIMAFFVVARLFILMILDHDAYSVLAANSQEMFSELLPTRGEVYIQDSRTKEEYPLAINRDFFLVFFDTTQIKDDVTAESAAGKLAEVFNYDDEKKLSVYLQLNKRDDPYEPIANKVDEETMDKLKELNLPGIGFERKYERFYPEGSLASQVIGFLGKTDDGGNIGRYGVEGYWQKELAGSGGFFSGAQSAAGRLISLAGSSFKLPENGVDILLTIDRTLQFKACERLREAVKEYQADSASLIIIEPFSGAILAMCSLPDFNPNAYNEAESNSAYNNSTIYIPFEPGSIFKPITMSAALNEDVVKTETRFFDPGFADAGCGKQIKNAGNKSYGEQSMVGVLENSINTGMVFVVNRLGKDKFKQYVENFGFGVEVGIELDSEAAGDIESLSRNKDKEFDCYTATASFGQGLTATPLQLVTAFAAIANGGLLMKPYIIQEIRYPDGRVDYAKKKEIRRVIEPRTASLLNGMLVNVVDNGQAKRAGVKGYYVAGKTGTAQIAGPGGYTQDYNHSFVGFAPVDDPKFVMIVKFEKPAEIKYADSTTAPVFADIAKFILQYYQVPPTR